MYLTKEVVIKMIDKNGKLFGKISIIDIGIIILLLIAASFLIIKLGIFSPQKIASVKTDKIRITFYQEEVNSFTANNVKLNDPANEKLLNISFGNVVDIKINNSVSWGVDKGGKQVLSSKEGWSSVLIDMEAAGILSQNGITLGGSSYYVGQTIVLRAGTSTFYGRIYSAAKV